MNNEEILKLRIKAIYHSLMSSACFKMEDSRKESNKEESVCLAREANVYESSARTVYEALK